MTAPAIYGFVSQCAIIAAVLIVCRDLATKAATPRGSIVFFCVAIAVALTPLPGGSVWEHLRGLWGDASVVTTSLLLLYGLSPSRLPSRPPPTIAALLVLAVFGALYLPVLAGVDLFGIDVYSLGWRPWIMLGAIVAICLVLWRRIDLRWMRLIALALLAYAADIMESANLWDYLIDPGLVVGLACVAFVTPWSQRGPETPLKRAPI
ncbi:MAG: hypothetical protein EXS03_03940 [Phycisphaerales bacterium]|nr:hypothetical protein [Phycisphaerales bacterium]